MSLSILHESITRLGLGTQYGIPHFYILVRQVYTTSGHNPFGIICSLILGACQGNPSFNILKDLHSSLTQFLKSAKGLAQPSCQ